MNPLPKVVIRNGQTGHVLSRGGQGTIKVRTFRQIPKLEGFPARVVGTEQASRIEYWPEFDSTPVRY